MKKKTLYNRNVKPHIVSDKERKTTLYVALALFSPALFYIINGIFAFFPPTSLWWAGLFLVVGVVFIVWHSGKTERPYLEGKKPLPPEVVKRYGKEPGVYYLRKGEIVKEETKEE